MDGLREWALETGASGISPDQANTLPLGAMRHSPAGCCKACRAVRFARRGGVLGARSSRRGRLEQHVTDKQEVTDIQIRWQPVDGQVFTEGPWLEFAAELL